MVQGSKCGKSRWGFRLRIPPGASPHARLHARGGKYCGLIACHPLPHRPYDDESSLLEISSSHRRSEQVRPGLPYIESQLAVIDLAPSMALSYNRDRTLKAPTNSF